MSIPPPPPPPPPPGGFPPSMPPSGDPYFSGGSPSGSREHPRAVTVLILGVVGLACCGLLAPVAWVLGNTVVREIDAAPGYYTNRPIANAGRICGIVGTAFLVASLMWIAFAGPINISFGT